MIRLTVVLFITIVFPYHGWAQSIQIENFGLEDGLPSVETYFVFQDKKGFIWFATDNGIARFDGQEMKAYHVKQGLPDPVVFAFQEDSKGRIWFRSHSGKLAYFSGDKIHPYQYNKLLLSLVNSDLVHAIHPDENDGVWICTTSEIIYIDRNGKARSEQTTSGSFYVKIVDGKYIYGICGPPTIANFLEIDGKRIPLQLSKKHYPSQVLQLLQWKDKILFSIGSNIFSYDGKKLTNLFVGNSPIISLSLDKTDNLWVGYLNNGVDHFTDLKLSKGWTPPIVGDKSVTKVLEDNEGGLWFTTLEKGVYYAPRQGIEIFQLNNQSKINAVAHYNNNVVMGDFKGNLIAINPVTKHIEWTKSFPSSIISIFPDKRDNLWVSNRSGILALDKNFNKVNETNITKVDFSESPSGELWAVGGGRITKIEGLKILPPRPLYNVMRAICVTDSSVYIACRSGLEIYSRNLDLRSVPAALSDLKITDIIRANDSTLVLATSGAGFALFNEKTLHLTRFDSENSLMANNIYSTLLDDSLLWLGTENGVIRTNINKLINGQVQFEYLNKKSGLAGNKVNHLLKVQNSIWAFTEEGISIIPDSLQYFNTGKPTFYLKTMTVNRVPVDLINNRELPYDQNDITLSFGFISFNNNESIRTRFRLSQNESWTYGETRELQFFSLSPGAYSLTLEYSLDNNQWTTAIQQLIFFINPPWWRVWYYQLTTFLVISMFAFLYFRSRLAVSRQKQHYLAVINHQQQKLLQTEIQTTERERSRIAKDLHDTVGTNLAAIKMSISQLLRKHEEPLAENIETQLHDVIKETKEIIYNLVPPGAERFGLFVLTRNHITKLNRTTQPQIELSTSGNDIYHADLNIIIFRIIQELIANSLKHAQATTILVGINTFADHVNILFEDNGVGFSGNDNTEGFGLLNIQSRVESLNGDIKFESGVAGTAYAINIPYLS